MKLIIENLKKSFKTKEVLKDVDIEFSSGIITGLLGRNGAGKTTLFNIIYGDIGKDEGQIFLEDEKGRRKISQEDVGMVFAESILPPFLTGYEYIKFYIDLHGDLTEKSPDYYLDMVDFSNEDRNRLINGYSSGMKAKLALLPVIIQKPKVILLDEPLTSLDVVMAEEIKKIFLNLKDDHIIVLSTHMLDLAKDLCNKVVMLHGGKAKELQDLDSSDLSNRIIEILSDETYD